MNSKAFLCRGIRKDTKKWVEGYYICLHSDTDMHIIVDAVDGQYHQVIPETVGRYTGFTDRNGTNIFEGDIVAFGDGTDSENGYCEHDCNGYVFWCSEEACFGVTGRLSGESYEVFEECWVTGNIHDDNLEV